VAGHTFDRCSGVGISQRKLGAIVLKPAIGVFPVPFGVAICALLSKVALVFVIFLMAPVTLLGSLLEHGTFVARLAFFFGVLSQQREGGGSVVKLGRLLPASFTMAAATVFAQRLLVLVVAFMACVAILAQFVFVQISGMAVLTERRAVFSPQSIFGVRIVVKATAFP
jgi:hypothetical protein